jgi:hypothetical protein
VLWDNSACVNIATGAMRLIDPLAGQACTSEVGAGQEREISRPKTAREPRPAARRRLT